MKTLFITTLFFTTIVQGKSVTAHTCYAQCLGVNTYARAVSFLGNVRVAGETRFGTWDKLNRKCEKSARRNGLNPLLVKDSIFFDLDQSWDSSSWYNASASARSSFYYTQAVANSSGGRTFHQTDRFTLDVEFTNPASACTVEKVSEEDMVEYYDGDLPIQG